LYALISNRQFSEDSEIRELSFVSLFEIFTLRAREM